MRTDVIHRGETVSPARASVAPLDAPMRPAGTDSRPMSTAPAVRVHRSLTKGLKLFDADRLRWLDEAAALGPVVALRMGPVKTWVITDAEVAGRCSSPTPRRG